MGRVTVLAGAYRPWAIALTEKALPPTYALQLKPDRLLASFRRKQPMMVALVGWSWLVPPEIYNAVPTVCLHPSPLPRYRGGSPLQHQIMAGETVSAVTLFRVEDGAVDTGPVYCQEGFSLDGSLADVFERIVAVGAPMLARVADAICSGRGWTPAPQPHRNAFVAYPRRTPEQSELTPAALAEMTGRDIRNFIRALDHPEYPRAFLRGRDGEPVEIGLPT